MNQTTNKVSIALLALAGATSTADGLAGEKGRFQGTAVLTNVAFQMIKTSEGNPGGSVMMGEMDGLIFNDAKQKFLDKAHYQVWWKGDGRGNGDCFKTFTLSDGDKLYGSCAGHATATGWEGTITLTGGTGRYTGAQGNGKYKLTTVSERVMWDAVEFDYELK